MKTLTILSIGDRETRSAIEDSARETSMRGEGEEATEVGRKWFERFLFGCERPNDQPTTTQQLNNSARRSTASPPSPFSVSISSIDGREGKRNYTQAAQPHNPAHVWLKYDTIYIHIYIGTPVPSSSVLPYSNQTAETLRSQFGSTIYHNVTML